MHRQRDIEITGGYAFISYHTIGFKKSPRCFAFRFSISCSPFRLPLLLSPAQMLTLLISKTKFYNKNYSHRFHTRTGICKMIIIIITFSCHSIHFFFLFFPSARINQQSKNDNIVLNPPMYTQNVTVQQQNVRLPRKIESSLYPVVESIAGISTFLFCLYLFFTFIRSFTGMPYMHCK